MLLDSLGDDFWNVSVFRAALGWTVDTCASVLPMVAAKDSAFRRDGWIVFKGEMKKVVVQRIGTQGLVLLLALRRVAVASLWANGAQVTPQKYVSDIFLEQSVESFGAQDVKEKDDATKMFPQVPISGRFVRQLCYPSAGKERTGRRKQRRCFKSSCTPEELWSSMWTSLCRQSDLNVSSPRDQWCGLSTPPCSRGRDTC